MKNIIAISSLVLGLFYPIISTAQAYDTNASFMKGNQSAVTIELNYPEELVENAIRNKLSKSGFNEKMRRGIISYKGIILHEVSDEKIDAYFLIDKKSRSEKDKTIVQMLVSNGYDNFITPTKDSLTNAKIKLFMNSLNSELSNYAAEMDLQKKQHDIADAEKHYNNLIVDKNDLENKKTAIEKRLIEKTGEIEKQKNLLENQRIVIQEATKNKNN